MSSVGLVLLLASPAAAWHFCEPNEWGSYQTMIDQARQDVFGNVYKQYKKSSQSDPDSNCQALKDVSFNRFYVNSKDEDLNIFSYQCINDKQFYHLKVNYADQKFIEYSDTLAKWGITEVEWGPKVKDEAQALYVLNYFFEFISFQKTVSEVEANCLEATYSVLPGSTKLELQYKRSNCLNYWKFNAACKKQGGTDAEDISVEMYVDHEEIPHIIGVDFRFD